MSAGAIWLYFAEGATKSSTEEQVGDNKVQLVWKVILRTGTWKLRPGPGGIKIKKPLKVYRDKAPKGQISMSELVKNFDDNAVEYVTVPLRHEDGTMENTGYVRKLVIQDVKGEDGSKTTESLLWAGFEITEPDVAGKIERKTIPSVSAGVLFDYDRTEDAKKFGQVLIHVMLTNKPWINGTGEFKKELPEGVMASEPDELPTESAEFHDGALLDDPSVDPTKKPQPTTGTVVWKPSEGFAWIKGKIQRGLDERRRTLMQQFGEASYRLDYPYYSVDDVQGDGAKGKALICSGYGPEKESWVAQYSIDNADGHDNAIVDAYQNWTPARPEWVAASENTTIPNPAPSAAPAITLSPVHDESELRRAQRLRQERLGFGRTAIPTKEGGARMGVITDLLTAKGIELSDDERATIRAEEDEAARLRLNDEQRAQKDRETAAEAFLASLKDTPFDHPGTLKYINDVFLSDDGGPALELSETTSSGQRTKGIDKTATDILKGLFEALPKDAEGKMTLSAQATRLPDDHKPPEDPDGDDKKTPSQKSDAMLEEFREQGLDLGIPAGANGGGS